MSTNTSSKDHWSSKAYNAAADFVPKLTSTVISYLDVQPNDQILDIGCGDGPLTAQIAQAASSGRVLGVDSSKSFIQTAQSQHTTNNCSFVLHDARTLATCPEVITAKWDKIFSNAALHWILRDRTTRESFFPTVFQALKPGGMLVFEMGGHGNVAEVYTAIVSELRHAGVATAEIDRVTPWYFPSPEAMHETLTHAGFDVEKCYVEYRPTKLTAADDAGSGGIEGWVRLMGAAFLEVLPEDRRESLVMNVCDVVDPIITKEDGSKWLGYVRLRVVARKK